MVNIGHRPTYDNGALKVEVHILNWEGDLYGSNLRVSFMERIRDERPFNNSNALKAQLQADEKLCRARYTQGFLEAANNVGLAIIIHNSVSSSMDFAGLLRTPIPLAFGS